MALAKSFVWSDGEVELLLNVAQDYKAQKEGQNIDWETVKTKYADMCNCDSPCPNAPLLVYGLNYLYFQKQTGEYRS